MTMSRATAFTEAGARRVAAAVRDFESRDTHSNSPRPAAQRQRDDAAAYIVARVTTTDDTLLRRYGVTQQYMSDGKLIDLPNGITLDGTAAWAQAVYSLHSPGDRVLLGVEGTDWYIIPIPRIQHLLGRIDGTTLISTGRWNYNFVEVEPSGATEYTDVVDGRTGTTYGAAINGAEVPNSGSGLQGNGYDLDSDIATDNTTALRPIVDGVVVEMSQVMSIDDDGEVTFRFHFSESNGISMVCGT